MELGFLKPLYSAPGPVASVYLDTTRATENAEHEIALRWRAQREHLAEAGASAELLDALEEAVGTDSSIPGPQGQALFGAEGRLLMNRTMARPPARNRSTLLPIADPLDMLADLDATLPHVVVAIDRVGVDVYSYGPFGEAVAARTTEGQSLHVNKVPGGGWRHRHYQHHTEEVWFHNAKKFAEDVEQAAREVSAAAVLVGGDVRAMEKLQQHLSPPIAELLKPLPSGGRADAAAEESLGEHIGLALEDLAEGVRADVLREFHEELKRGGGATQGVLPTIAALRKGQVAKLLLAPHRVGETTLWTQHDPMELAVDREELTAPGESFSAPASTVLMRAAYATGAEFSSLSDPGDADEGVGALLRFQLNE